MRCQNCRADTIRVDPRTTPVQRQQASLPFAPFFDKGFGRGRKASLQAGRGIFRRLLRRRSETQRQQRRRVRSRKADLAGQRDIAVLGPAASRVESAVTTELLPAVGDTDIAGRACSPRQRRGERQANATSRCKQDRPSLVVADPGGVGHAGVDQMRRQQRVDAVVGVCAAQRREADFLQQNRMFRIRNDALFDPVGGGGVDQPVGGHPILERLEAVHGIALFFREIEAGAGDDQSHVSGAGAVEAGIIDLVEDAVADREPDRAGRRKRGSDAALGARRPARRNSGWAQRISRRRCHLDLVSCPIPRPGAEAFSIIAPQVDRQTVIDRC